MLMPFPCPWSLSFHIIPWSSFLCFFYCHVYTIFYFSESGAYSLVLLPNSSNHLCPFLSPCLLNWILYTSNWPPFTELGVFPMTLMPWVHFLWLQELFKIYFNFCIFSVIFPMFSYPFILSFNQLPECTRNVLIFLPQDRAIMCELCSVVWVPKTPSTNNLAFTALITKCPFQG